MKPHVICHMVSSIDGRILSSRMAAEGRQLAGACSSVCTTQLKGDAWLIGRVTGQ